MGRKITAANIFDSVEIDLWGNAYTLREGTRSISEKLQEAQAQARELDQETASVDDLADALIGILDILLAPAEGGASSADVLRPLWEEDRLGLDWLSAFVSSLEEEAGQRRRPTSPTRRSA
jgi:hypothetical protein